MSLLTGEIAAPQVDSDNTPKPVHESEGVSIDLNGLLAGVLGDLDGIERIIKAFFTALAKWASGLPDHEITEYPDRVSAINQAGYVARILIAIVADSHERVYANGFRGEAYSELTEPGAVMDKMEAAADAYDRAHKVRLKERLGGAPAHRLEVVEAPHRPQTPGWNPRHHFGWSVEKVIDFYSLKGVWIDFAKELYGEAC